MEAVLRYLLVVGVVIGITGATTLIYIPIESKQNSYSLDKGESQTPPTRTGNTDKTDTVSADTQPGVQINRANATDTWFKEVGKKAGLAGFDLREYVNISDISPPKEGDEIGRAHV